MKVVVNPIPSSIVVVKPKSSQNTVVQTQLGNVPYPYIPPSIDGGRF